MSEKIKINGLDGNRRKSTQELLLEIDDAVEKSFTEITVDACGQHDVGGPLWNRNGKPLKFYVKNPGQRVGSMGMHGTTIIVEGSATADTGWLNAGAEIIVRGNSGDTTAHCAATGKIYVGGSVGSRSGALMKYDPKFSPPEFWVLKNTGSFSFEFMGGGIAVVCGYGCEEMESVLGYRSCVGMVGGVVYVRGNVKDLSDDVWLMDIDDKDWEFLDNNLPIFLKKIQRPGALGKLLKREEWKKIVAKSHDERNDHELPSLRDFRLNKWVEGGIFGDMLNDDFKVAKFVETGDLRLKYPEWRNANYSAPCEYNCPTYIPTQKRISLLRQGKVKEALELVLDYSPFPASVCGQVCPNLCMDECSRKNVDIPINIGELGLLSKDIPAKKCETTKLEKVAIVGSGAAGLAAAYQLRLMGYEVDIYEQDSELGGKLRQVIPEERLDRGILEFEIKRILDMGVKAFLNTKIDNAKMKNLLNDYDAVVLAIGAHSPVVLPVEGHEKLVKGLDFLKAINRGELPAIGNNVVVIGAGNAGMDVVLSAYKLGAKKVTAIDIQKPAAFEKEINHARELGAEILWPCYTEKITDEGVVLKDGRVLPADTVIISIGDRPEFIMLDKNYLDERGKIKINEYYQSEINPKLFVAGDAIKLGLFTHALGDGRKVALNIDRMFKGLPLSNFAKAPMIPQDRIKKEYYEQINLGKTGKVAPEDETKRCLSCGFCRDCELCLNSCPEQAISRIQKDGGKFEYISNPNKCIGCGICAGICPCGIWEMIDNTMRYLES
ncbi:FAD-dependent oxidoreductase [Calditerrivibrio nitroreducens]|uniref:dihydrouracil dehydrogenase (NAD(+)) n=1 Tax=Calditerrivibrio nitroreducens (strain DSM 19672 / NBRC 101217 / Yu37-1) TaxID=768670 RepID=E4TJ49_CALNY|nr:FAD-dependent oxidoreductase [Calditerrivibrio nitroreducens]ADR18085.1 glutamate synthase (NADPH) GltB3 subunit [Calditerrivibrio nitroreducens DSM 19672]